MELIKSDRKSLNLGDRNSLLFFWLAGGSCLLDAPPVFLFFPLFRRKITTALSCLHFFVWLFGLDQDTNTRGQQVCACVGLFLLWLLLLLLLLLCLLFVVSFAFVCFAVCRQPFFAFRCTFLHSFCSCQRTKRAKLCRTYAHIIFFFFRTEPLHTSHSQHTPAPAHSKTTTDDHESRAQ